MDIGVIEKYIEDNIEKTLKEPHGFIRYPFIDPGSVYEGNVWDWDSFWCVYGLLPRLDRMRGGALKDKILLHAMGNVRNFLDWQLPDGYIPMMIEVGEWPEPYLNMRHKQGRLMNMHKPFLCQQIALISEYTGDWEWILESGSTEQIARYFACYRSHYYKEHCGLYVWRDDIMIGMDNDPASFGRPASSTANIYLNSFMVMELEAAEKLYLHAERKAEAGGDRETARLERARVRETKAHKEALISAIHTEMYDRRDGFFYSQDVDIRTRRYDWFHQGLGVFWKTLPIRIAVWSGFLPMLAGFATSKEAESLRQWYRRKEAFGTEYGITTLDRREKMYCVAATNNPSNWLGPVWIVANYCVFRGMLNYGFVEEAEEICAGTVKLLVRDLREHGCLHEYYDPADGKPVMNGGFLNWNILALNMAEELEAAAAKVTSA